jgi:hypothetical protein
VEACALADALDDVWPELPDEVQAVPPHINKATMAPIRFLISVTLPTAPVRIPHRNPRRLIKNLMKEIEEWEM